MPAATNLCCILTCPNRYACNINLKKHSLFRFPKDPSRCEVWLKHSGREELNHFSPEELHNKNYRVCSLHFSGEMFAGVRLKKFAFPTIKAGETTSSAPPQVNTNQQDPSERESAPENRVLNNSEVRVAPLMATSDVENFAQSAPSENPVMVSPPSMPLVELYGKESIEKLVIVLDQSAASEYPIMVSPPLMSPVEVCDYWLRIP